MIKYSLCGSAYTNYFKSGFNLIALKKSCGSKTLAHEIGHTAGCFHQRSLDAEDRWYEYKSKYNYGAYFKPKQGTWGKGGYVSGYRTVMTYYKSGYWNVAPVFSSWRKKVKFEGYNTGTSEHTDNAWVLTQNRFVYEVAGDESG